MNSSAMSSRLYTLMLSFLLTAFCFNSLLSSASETSYADHCNSVVPESTIQYFEPEMLSVFQFEVGYYHGGGVLLSQNPSENLHSLTFYIQRVFSTKKDGVFSIEGNLAFPSQSSFYYLQNLSTFQYRPERFRGISPIHFSLNGFWSETSGKLCMVGTSNMNLNQGKILNLQAVLRLSNLKNSSSITTMVTGTMESLSSTNDLSYFEPISIMIPPRMNYEFTLVTKEFCDDFSGGNDSVKSLPISSLPLKSFCLITSRAVTEFNLRYTNGCNSSENCGPFGAAIGYLPNVVSFKINECLEKEERMRVLVEFRNSNHFFNLNTTLIGEALWDDRINQLCVVACRFLNTTESFANAQVGDCTTRLRLGFPAIWSIRDTSNVVGEIWSKKSVNDSGYFNKIMFQSSESPFRTYPGLKYEYTEINKVKSSCWLKEKLKKKKGKGYPYGYSSDMQFDMWVKNSKINTSWGAATVLSVGDKFYHRYMYPISSSSSRISKSAVEANLRDIGPVNVSYIIGIKLQHGVNLGGTISHPVMSLRYEQLKFSAEGIYDAETGQLCMVGCRHIVSKNQLMINDSLDCEVLIKFQFPPSNPKKDEGYIKGSIKSTRVVSDPLYFEPLDVSSITYTAPVIKKAIVRMDLEITIAAITNTLACVFVGLQLFHVKKYPDVLPFISLVMLLILILGHMIPLVLNFEALFLQNRQQQTVVLGTGGWLEVNKVLVRMITMVAFLLEVRLLQLSCSARSAGADQVSSWFAEKLTLFIYLPLYAAGVLIFLLVNRIKHRHYDVLLSFRQIHPQQFVWLDLKSYAGLVLDGFLLPQILFNAFRNSKENVLSYSFYIGTTFVRLLPHAYDLYRAYNYDFVGSYLYAAPNSGFYSTAWDVIIPLGGLFLAAIIFLQQWFGGRCIIPQKFRKDEAYERVLVSESQLPKKSSPCDGPILTTAGSVSDCNK